MSSPRRSASSSRDGLPYQAASWSLWRDHRAFVPYATIPNWVEAGGEKGDAADRDRAPRWALTDFSGYIAADELYDGRFCILSIVANRTFKRLAYQVLRRDPKQGGITVFFRRFQAALEQRGLVLRRIATDGSSLYPAPIAEVFGDVPHQLRTCHVVRELTKAVLGAVAKVRKELAAHKPKLKRGCPATKEAQCKARQKKRLEQKYGDLFEHRYLFVRRRFSSAERRTLLRISRGLPQLRTLRTLLEEVYRLFDRRCRTDTTLAKLARLRVRVPLPPFVSILT